MQKEPCAPTLGADVEYFLQSREDEKIYPACGLIGGTKEKPLKICNGYYVQEDNVMVEFNVKPADTWTRFADNVNYAIEVTDDYVRDVTDNKYRIICKNQHKFPVALLDSPQAQTFGCEPDNDAYLGGEQRRMPNDAMGNYRTCGGHIHFGGDFQCPDFVSALFIEFYIGVLAEARSPASKRVRWYGAPGVFRSKPYGVEYRTPDNTWTDDQHLKELIGLYGMRVCEFLTNSKASDLRTSFRAIPWLKVRDWMNHKYEYNQQEDRSRLIDIASQAGLRW